MSSGSVDRRHVRILVETYLTAWERQDATLLADVFTQSATYRERAYSNQYVGLSQIQSYWVIKVLAAQANIKCNLRELYVDGEVAIAEWEAEFDDLVRNERKRMTEVAVMTVKDGKISSFREYWSSVRIGSLHNS